VIFKVQLKKRAEKMIFFPAPFFILMMKYLHLSVYLLFIYFLFPVFIDIFIIDFISIDN